MKIKIPAGYNCQFFIFNFIFVQKFILFSHDTAIFDFEIPSKNKQLFLKLKFFKKFLFKIVYFVYDKLFFGTLYVKFYF